MASSGLLTERAVERLELDYTTLSGDVVRHTSAGVDGHAATGILQSPFNEVQVPAQVVSAVSFAATLKLPSGSLSAVLPVIPL